LFFRSRVAVGMPLTSLLRLRSVRTLVAALTAVPSPGRRLSAIVTVDPEAMLSWA
jgi:hypothetical protein